MKHKVVQTEQSGVPSTTRIDDARLERRGFLHVSDCSNIELHYVLAGQIARYTDQSGAPSTWFGLSLVLLGSSSDEIIKLPQAISDFDSDGGSPLPRQKYLSSSKV